MPKSCSGCCSLSHGWKWNAREHHQQMLWNAGRRHNRLEEEIMSQAHPLPCHEQLSVQCAMASPCSEIEINKLKAWMSATTRIGYIPVHHNRVSSFVRPRACVRMRKAARSVFSVQSARHRPEISDLNKTKGLTFAEFEPVRMSWAFGTATLSTDGQQGANTNA